MTFPVEIFPKRFALLLSMFFLLFLYPGKFRYSEHADGVEVHMLRGCKTYPASGSAHLSFASSAEPWVYCASHYRADSELRRLRSEFSGKFGYSSVIRILDADTFVHVYYGPVNYEDVSGRLDKQAQWFDPNAGSMAWFTKNTSFANQSEYRFAVATPGTPVRPRHYVAVSPELRELTCAV